MKLSVTSTCLVASAALASPLAQPAEDRTAAATMVTGSHNASPHGGTTHTTASFPIHASCNVTERAQLERAFGETIKLARHAKEHILEFAHSSLFYKKYFGNASTAEPIGWFEKVANGNHDDILFRCDDIDGNCHQDGWSMLCCLSWHVLLDSSPSSHHRRPIELHYS